VDAFFCSEGFKALRECGCLPSDMAEKMAGVSRRPPSSRPGGAEEEADLGEGAAEVGGRDQEGSDFLDLDTSQDTCGSLWPCR
jgi:hypothetical protein